MIVTLGPLGYLPAPGTWGTLCAVPVMYALRTTFDISYVCIIVLAIACIALGAIHYALPQFGGHGDPAQIVIDEFVGFAALACCIPYTPIMFMAGFLFFRFFDILKPLGIKRIEAHWDGALGIMLDDLLAAGYAAICVWGVNVILSYLNKGCV